jgi:preprotein translocase YajC subunit
MFLQLLLLFAEGDPAPAGGKPGGMDISFLLPMLAVLALMYFFFFRQRGNDQSSKDALGLQKNDKVLLFGVIIGQVVSVHETLDEVTVKLDDNLRVKFTKSAIHRNFSHEERQKAASETKEAPKAEAPAGTGESIRKA